MKAGAIALLAFLGLPQISAASSIASLLPELCVEYGEQKAFLGPEGSKHVETYAEGDIQTVSRMPLWNAAFARPSQFEVCSDDEFI